MHKLADLARPCGIYLSDEAAVRFETYHRLLLEWNERVNLTAITQLQEVLEKHFLDSIAPLSLLEIPQGAAIIDVGTGAGFPGVPLKIARPDLRLTLLDSLNKRIDFLRELSAALGQENTLIHARAEDAAHDPTLRETFYAATSRAVAALPTLCELCLPFVQPGGVFFALKGPDADTEIALAQSASAILGGGTIQVENYTLPSFGRRSVCIAKKASQTPTKYPRKPKQMSRAPL
ncbi:MAG: 16S rRNA (guanine(527)-N(7))-methyltransferase RsmG [Oscillospiraceae bacterium]|nr:16S rRNA (guanine(527)-N(7))-methyltransferase RsmG [Oscillospiraceae bacterium]